MWSMGRHAVPFHATHRWGNVKKSKRKKKQTKKAQQETFVTPHRIRPIATKLSAQRIEHLAIYRIAITKNSINTLLWSCCLTPLFTSYSQHDFVFIIYKCSAVVLYALYYNHKVCHVLCIYVLMNINAQYRSVMIRVVYIFMYDLINLRCCTASKSHICDKAYVLMSIHIRCVQSVSFALLMNTTGLSEFFFFHMLFIQLNINWISMSFQTTIHIAYSMPIIIHVAWIERQIEKKKQKNCSFVNHNGFLVVFTK